MVPGVRKLVWLVGALIAASLPSSAAALQRDAAPSELVFSSTFSGNRQIFTSAADGSRITATALPSPMPHSSSAEANLSDRKSRPPNV